MPNIHRCTHFLAILGLLSVQLLFLLPVPQAQAFSTTHKQQPRVFASSSARRQSRLWQQQPLENAGPSAQQQPPIEGTSFASAASATVSPNSMADDLPPPAQQQQHGKRSQSQRQRRPPLPVVTPYHILHPHVFFDSDSETASHDRALPLFRVLKLMRQALDVLATDNTNANTREPAWLPSNRDDADSASPRILRIEHLISHTADPLGWLHAQTAAEAHAPHDANSNPQQQQEQPIVYFQSVEGDFEAASIGSAVTLQDTESVWDTWAAMLPGSSRLYGGERFDKNENITVSEEWKDFGQAFWMLPTVELRQQTVQVPGGSRKQTVLAIHLVATDGDNNNHSDFSAAAADALKLLHTLTERVSAAVPPTTLPPILSRDSNYGPDCDGQELYENAVAETLRALEEGDLDKVVLARKQTMHFGVDSDSFSALDILRRWKYGGHEGGHLFLIRPVGGAPEFFGCTPERLFQIHPGGKVRSEALAGTRPRGSTQAADEELLRELLSSPKDLREHSVTGKYIESAFRALADKDMVSFDGSDGDGDEGSGFFARRLLHLQHICQRFSATIKEDDRAMDVARELLTTLHPTPAVCGLPLDKSRDFIRKHESIGFDRGFYAGPVGHIGRDSADILVAIRSGLATQAKESPGTNISVYAGAGLVPGSTLQGEWAETNLKLAVIASIFPQSPITLQGAPTPNVAWATAFVEELIRNGVRRFYICPGSRSTPLVAAIAKAVRSNVGVVKAVSVHDERAAGFRALGYARGANRPAVVITSSGTAVANLYPAVVEAGMDGVPMLILTADRPYESRDSGANQAIDQVKIFSSSYVRWFRDILPPGDDIPVSVALSDASHAVSVSKAMRGPVHLNIQFRENLAPDNGSIRNDGRVDSVIKYNAFRFTDTPRFSQWSTSGGRWMRDLSSTDVSSRSSSVLEIARLIANSKRGIIVVGNLRSSTAENEIEDQSLVAQTISDFAISVGLPIFAGAQAANLRFQSSAVVPFAEHILKCSLVAENLKPDFILQIGSPLLSTEIPSAIVAALKDSGSQAHHVLLHPHLASERADPNLTVTHKVSAEISPFLKALLEAIETNASPGAVRGSELAPLVVLGRKVQAVMEDIIHDAAHVATPKNSQPSLTEPEIVLALAQAFTVNDQERALFLSNSMPIRDAEFFLYPIVDGRNRDRKGLGPKGAGSNRGASGIDGIISSALGFAEGMEVPTTLLIGDLATLHDINSLHSLANDATSNAKQSPGRKRRPLTAVIVNNDGGGIFSFLPIAKHGADVSFDEFFGTPTSSFSYYKGAEAFGLSVVQSSDFPSFKKAYEEGLKSDEHNIIEAKVAGRDVNVAVHRQITKNVDTFVTSLLSQPTQRSGPEYLPIKVYSQDIVRGRLSWEDQKILVVLHGWMGEATDWDKVGMLLTDSLPADWRVVSVDLPGHGSSRLQKSSDIQSLRSALQLDGNVENCDSNVDAMAESVLFTLSNKYGIKKVDAIAGYSLGGRVALAMKRLSESLTTDTITPLIQTETKLVLLSASPGELSGQTAADTASESRRIAVDDNLSAGILSHSNKAVLLPTGSFEDTLLWSKMLERWYSVPIWGALNQTDSLYSEIISKRSAALSRRGRDLAVALAQCSPPRNQKEDWTYCSSRNTLFIAGSLDAKYSTIGKTWSKARGVRFEEIPCVGHALLAEAPSIVAALVTDFIADDHPKARAYEKLSSSQSDRDMAVVSEEKKVMPTTVVSLKTREAGVLYRDRQEVVRPRDSTSPGLLESLDFEAFSINLMDGSRNDKNVLGIGWGENAAPNEASRVDTRSGFIIQFDSSAGLEVGIGEVSPLSGLHTESLDDAKEQLMALKDHLNSQDESSLPSFDASEILQLDGKLGEFLTSLACEAGLDVFLPSVRSGLEMALLTLASQKVSLPIHKALYSNSKEDLSPSTSPLLPLNGLISRGPYSWSTASTTQDQVKVSFPSLKVKVGHQELADDALAISHAFQRTGGKIRADANRAWNQSQAIEFASALEGLDLHAFDRLEFVEEPLLKETNKSGKWSLAAQVDALERWYQHTGIPFALDESIADLAQEHSHHPDSVLAELRTVFSHSRRGCGAFVLKPALLGLELSAQIARLAKKEFGIAAVFSSSFDSGVGLAHTAFLGSLTERIVSTTQPLPHGVGTFSLLQGDTLTPPFGSYVNEDGLLNVPSLSRAFYGLSLEEMRDSLATVPIPKPSAQTVNDSKENEYEATTCASSSGKEISVVVALQLPFSAAIAHSRFTDLPQQSRWSPWISSVSYQGKETEWTLNVRGAPLKWRATSHLLSDPWLGIQWESVSGLSNRGVAEFVPDGKDDDATTCQMNVRMTIVTPRILRPLFQGTSLFVEDFLRDKLLKWSLEMFRDVVKADLALERGDVELGDALIGSVEGKASAIEATLNFPTAKRDD
jgi:2-succinyl-5-enolpyruvyl-6-hydroxy-3-cyclohexene-1-carboxylate synthase/o-succinylbenzoate synthase